MNVHVKCLKRSENVHGICAKAEHIFGRDGLRYCFFLFSVEYTHNARLLVVLVLFEVFHLLLLQREQGHKRK